MVLLIRESDEETLRGVVITAPFFIFVHDE